jgi:hypothetical protein
MKKHRIYLFTALVLILSLACACPGSTLLSRATATPTRAVPTVRLPTVRLPTIVVPTIKVPTIVVPTILVPTIVVPTMNAVPIKSPYVKDVIMALGVQGDYLDPVNPTQVFNKDAIIHAVVQLQNAPANTQVAAAWFVVDVGGTASPNTKIDEKVFTTSGTRNIDFTMKPTTTWPTGSYRVDISINGILSNRVTFSVR